MFEFIRDNEIRRFFSYNQQVAARVKGDLCWHRGGSGTAIAERLCRAIQRHERAIVSEQKAADIAASPGIQHVYEATLDGYADGHNAA